VARCGVNSEIQRYGGGKSRIMEKQEAAEKDSPNYNYVK